MTSDTPLRTLNLTSPSGPCHLPSPILPRAVEAGSLGRAGRLPSHSLSACLGVCQAPGDKAQGSLAASRPDLDSFPCSQALGASHMRSHVCALLGLGLTGDIHPVLREADLSSHRGPPPPHSTVSSSPGLMAHSSSRMLVHPQEPMSGGPRSGSRGPPEHPPLGNKEVSARRPHGEGLGREPSPSHHL